LALGSIISHCLRDPDDDKDQENDAKDHTDDGHDLSGLALTADEARGIGLVGHDDADDVVQNVMMKAWTHLDTFQGQAKLSTWLYRIAINESLDFMRRQKTHAAVSADVADNGVAATLMADDYFDGDATAAKLQEAIATLPDAQRTVFTLRYFDEMKYSDISDMLGTSEGALKASYHIAAKKIYEFFMHND